MTKEVQLNVFHEPIEDCGFDPLTGFFRSGCCETSNEDIGNHTVCALMSQEFLEFSFNRGNDLINPVPEFNFPGLKAGDRWCLCANRWVEAYEANCAPKIYLTKTHINTLKLVNLAILREYALDIN